jgi:hypothetical protein
MNVREQHVVVTSHEASMHTIHVSSVSVLSMSSKVVDGDGVCGIVTATGVSGSE